MDSLLFEDPPQLLLELLDAAIELLHLEAKALGDPLRRPPQEEPETGDDLVFVGKRFVRSIEADLSSSGALFPNSGTPFATSGLVESSSPGRGAGTGWPTRSPGAFFQEGLPRPTTGPPVGLIAVSEQEESAPAELDSARRRHFAPARSGSRSRAVRPWWSGKPALVRKMAVVVHEARDEGEVPLSREVPSPGDEMTSRTIGSSDSSSGGARFSTINLSAQA
jgi:hypothetical protein